MRSRKSHLMIDDVGICISHEELKKHTASHPFPPITLQCRNPTKNTKGMFMDVYSRVNFETSKTEFYSVVCSWSFLFVKVFVRANKLFHKN